MSEHNTYIQSTAHTMFRYAAHANVFLDTNEFRDNGYTLLLRHLNVSDGIFSPEVALTGIDNANNSYANTYSIIGAVDPVDFLSADGDFEFGLIYYDDAGEPLDVFRWSQRSWIEEYAVVGMDRSLLNDSYTNDTNSGFNGLALSSGNNAYIDGSPGGSNWWIAVAVYNFTNGVFNIPAYSPHMAVSSELWVRPGVPMDPAPVPTQIVRGDSYMLLVRHLNISNGFFDSTVKYTGVENPTNPLANTYCIVNAVDSLPFLLESGEYELELVYHYADAPSDTLRWSQKSWITDPFVVDVNLSSISDAYADDPIRRFTGLGRSVSGHALLDGTPGDKYWYHAVATINSYDGGGIPGHEWKLAIGSELWARQGM